MIFIEQCIWLEEIVYKIWSKHHVRLEEAEEVLENRPHIRFCEKGYRKNENVYVAFGKTRSGRYLMVVFIYKVKLRAALIVTARQMDKKERRRYENTREGKN